MFKAAVGHSEHIDAADAAEEIFSCCDEILGGAKPTAGLLFVSSSCEYGELLKLVNARYEGIELIGATSAGEISSGGAFMEDSSVLVLFSSDEVEIKAGIGTNASTDTKKAAESAVNEAKRAMKKDPVLCVALPDVTFRNGVELVDCLSAAAGVGTALIGGGASAQGGVKKTFQFYKNEVFTDSIAVLVFSAPLKYSFGAASGWKAIGSRKIVNKSERNIIFEIDNKPASEFYHNYFDCLGGVLGGEFPMMIFEDGESVPYIRAVIEVDCGPGNIKAAGDVKEGTTIQFAEAGRDEIIDGARESIETTVKNFTGRPEFLLVLSCAARKNILGMKTNLEYEALKNAAPQIAGFYTYGEIGPLGAGKPAKFHNATIITLLMGI